MLDLNKVHLIAIWSLMPDQLQIGNIRLLYPFFCGLLLSRIGKLITVKGGFWWCSIVIIVLFKTCLAVRIFSLAIGIAYASLKLYDDPVSEWLKQKFFTHKTM